MLQKRLAVSLKVEKKCTLKYSHFVLEKSVEYDRTIFFSTEATGSLVVVFFCDKFKRLLFFFSF